MNPNSCLRTQGQEKRTHCSQEEEFVSSRCMESQKTGCRCHEEQSPYPQRQLHRQRVKMEIPPAANSPGAPKVRPNSSLKIKALVIYALDVIHWKRHRP